MSRKQDIYREMLEAAEPHTRDPQCHEKSSRFEAQLVKDLPASLEEPGFTEQDVRFLNHQARWYVECCKPPVSILYDQQVPRIAELFALVPESLRSKLAWPGPDVRVSS